MSPSSVYAHWLAVIASPLNYSFLHAYVENLREKQKPIHKGALSVELNDAHFRTYTCVSPSICNDAARQ